jgi:HD-like signal output (HDOD) protein
MRRTTGHPEVAALRRFDQLAQLNSERLADLAARIEVREAAPGTALVELGSHAHSTLFLLDGRVRLEADDGHIRVISHRDAAARSPLCRLRPARWRALAASAVRYLEIADELLEEYLEHQAATPSSAGYAVNELVRSDSKEHDAAEHGLLFQLYDDLYRNRLALPSPPRVASGIGRRVAQLGNSPSRIAALLMLDPALALKTLRAANARLGPDRGVRSCRQAIAHLGADQVHDLVAQCALLETFRAADPELLERMQQWWERSLRASAISYVLAGMTELFDPEFAALVGLTQEVGEGAILAYAEQDPTLRAGGDALEACLRAHTADAGRMLLNRWSLPLELAAAAAQAGNWQRDPGHPGADYTDLALLAQLHARLDAAELQELPPLAQLPCARRLRIALDPDVSRDLLQVGQQAVAEAKTTLWG